MQPWPFFLARNTAFFQDLAQHGSNTGCNVGRPAIQSERARVRVHSLILLKMASFHKSRSSAYSEDMRWRMVWQREALGYSYADIAQNLCVDKSTVSRTLNLFRTTGSVAKKPYPEGKAFCKLTLPAQLLILHLVLEKPGIFLCEIRDELVSVEIEVTESAICKFLHKSGFTYQRLQVTALQQDEFLRQQFISEVSVYSPEMLVFIDETGTDRRGLVRKRGYSMRGKPLRNHTLLVRGERVSAIACISYSI